MGCILALFVKNLLTLPLKPVLSTFDEPFLFIVYHTDVCLSSIFSKTWQARQASPLPCLWVYGFFHHRQPPVISDICQKASLVIE